MAQVGSSTIVRMSLLNELNMKKEVGISETRARMLGYVSGVCLFNANLLLFVAAQTAKTYH